MAFTNITDLLGGFQKWFSDKLPKLRIDNKEQGYAFVANELGYDEDFKLIIADYNRFFDRTDLNKKYVDRYKNTNIKSKEPSAWIQSEINMMYSFHKCFAMRHHTRLQYYRNDLSQKGARTVSTMNLALAKLKYRSEVAEKTK